MLDAAYIVQAEFDARRFSGAYTGTSGTLAAHVMRLLAERKQMQESIAALESSLEDANAKLRAAVGDRLAGTPADDPKMTGYVAPGGCCDGGKCHAKPEPPQSIPVDWILRGQKELEAHNDDIRWTGDSILAEKSGTTAKFGTGAVRSSDVEEFRYDLVSPIGLREVARACAEGAEKYGDWNWEKGMPVHDLLNHVIAHIYKFLEGDRSEPHLGHAAWGMLAAIHSHEVWPHLNEGNLRATGCRAPTAEPV